MTVTIKANCMGFGRVHEPLMPQRLREIVDRQGAGHVEDRDLTIKANSKTEVKAMQQFG
jgi:hypothetical protein